MKTLVSDINMKVKKFIDIDKFLNSYQKNNTNNDNTKKTSLSLNFNFANKENLILDLYNDVFQKNILVSNDPKTMPKSLQLISNIKELVNSSISKNLYNEDSVFAKFNFLSDIVLNDNKRKIVSGELTRLNSKKGFGPISFTAVGIKGVLAAGVGAMIFIVVLLAAITLGIYLILDILKNSNLLTEDNKEGVRRCVKAIEADFKKRMSGFDFFLLNPTLIVAKFFNKDYDEKASKDIIDKNINSEESLVGVSAALILIPLIIPILRSIVYGFSSIRVNIALFLTDQNVLLDQNIINLKRDIDKASSQSERERLTKILEKQIKTYKDIDNFITKIDKESKVAGVITDKVLETADKNKGDYNSKHSDDSIELNI